MAKKDFEDLKKERGRDLTRDGEDLCSNADRPERKGAEGA